MLENEMISMENLERIRGAVEEVIAAHFNDKSDEPQEVQDEQAAEIRRLTENLFALCEELDPREKRTRR